ncbi:MAG: hypothetical protein KF680_03295 [Cryobacterium sp.]|nr:hypothetical protein [Cryobacterium sp.]
MSVTHPPLEPVRTIVAEFARRGWPVAVGGSAVLAWLGLVDVVRDWDVTVDADADEVEQALLRAGFNPEDGTSSAPPFATRRRLTLALPDHELDVLVGFAVHEGGAVVPIPVRAVATWNGLPIAHPGDWELAYRIMGRADRAAALHKALAESDWIGR